MDGWKMMGKDPAGAGLAFKSANALSTALTGEIALGRGVDKLPAADDAAVLDAELRHAVAAQRHLAADDYAGRLLLDEDVAGVGYGLGDDGVAVGDDGVDDGRAAVLARGLFVSLYRGDFVLGADRAGVGAEGRVVVGNRGLHRRHGSGVGDARGAVAGKLDGLVERGEERLAAEGVRRDEAPRAVYEHAYPRAKLALLAYLVPAAVLDHRARGRLLDDPHVREVHPSRLGDENYLFGDALSICHVGSPYIECAWT